MFVRTKSPMKFRRILSVWVAIGSALSIANVSQSAPAVHVPLQIKQGTPANYPPALLMEGVSSGEVWVLITVDDAGTLTDAMVTRYTHPGFTHEVLRAVRSWSYSPARVDGRPVSVRSELHLSFQSKGQVMTLDAASTVQQLTSFARRTHSVDHLCAPSDLDEVPSLLTKVPLVHPRKASDGSATEGRAVLDFIIDEYGKIRMPVVLSSTDMDFAAAATAALAQWRFTPPSRGGRPVAVQVRQEFVFPSSPRSDGPAGSPAKKLSSSTGIVDSFAL